MALTGALSTELASKWPLRDTSINAAVSKWITISEYEFDFVFLLFVVVVNEEKQKGKSLWKERNLKLLKTGGMIMRAFTWSSVRT